VNTRRILLLGGLLVVLSGQTMFAQFVRGAMVGKVTDEKGAAVAGAEVKLTNLGTNEARSAITDGNGDYNFPALLPGVYSLEVRRAGFKTQVVNRVELQVNQTARVDVNLPVGELSEVVETVASAVLLKTDTSEIGHVLTNKQIVELPLNGRDYLQLARLIPGATPSRAGATAGQKGVSRSVNVGGARDTSVSFLLDGIDTNDISFQTPTVTPSIDAIQEFKVLQNSYTAEFGRGATQILTALKSGSNQWHGSLFEFNRNSATAARGFFDARVAFLNQNQFGGTLGGPFIVPKLYHGKDRTFFFFNYEGQRIRTAPQQFAFVPTPAQLSGDFSTAGSPIIYDPLTFDAATRTRQPFAGNRIPANRISERAKKIAALYPVPNLTGQTGRNFTSSPAQKDDNDQINTRFDHKFSEKDNFFARYSLLNRFRTRYAALPYGGNVDDVRGQNVALNWVHTFSSALVNEARFGFNRSKYLTPPDSSIGENPARDLFGFTNTTTSPATSFGLPQFNFSGGITGLGPGSQFPQNAITQTEQFVDNLTWIRGTHTFKAGFDIRHTRLTQLVANNDRGTVSFTNQFTNLPSNSSGGSSIADMLLGFPQSVAAGVGDQLAHNLNELYSFYVQDDWKVSSRLTLNLGLRYEYATPWREKLNRYTVIDFNEARGRLLLAGTSNAFVPGQGIVDTGTKISETIIPPDRNNFGPRVGFAYRPLAKLVLRSGYGIFYDVQEGNEAQFLRNNAPYIFVQNTAADPFVPNLQLDTLFPPVTSGPSGAIQPFSVDPTSRTPYLQQWNLNIEYEVRPNLLAEVGYLGSKGTHLLRRSNFQQGDNILVKDPANPTPLAQRVRFPNFSNNVIIGTENGSSSTYHGLITKLERRLTRGVSLLASYTFSKTIDDASSSSNFSNAPSNAQCRCDLRGNKGPSAFEVRHRFVLSYLWELPFGKGKWLASSHEAVNKIIGGWQINGITAFQSGPPIQINTQGDNANIGTGAGSGNNQRPNLIGDPYGGIDTGANIKNRGVNAGTFYFNRAAFALPPQFRLGNLGKNTLYGPGFQNWDFSVFKNTSISERVNMQFRAEFFNFFNHANFNVPGLILNTPTFGVINSTVNSGRVIQFGLKVLF
jgi:Carboxypeptidase regulatory-like domain/TonB-dependent Receptor Plug Domain